MVDPNPARGMPLQLQRYWLAGKGAAKIRWNVPGDFLRCVRQLRKYFPKDPKGLCNILHTKATGGPPGHGSAEHHSIVYSSGLMITDRDALVAAQELMDKQPTLGQVWAGPIAPIGIPTQEPRDIRVFEAGALRHRMLPLPLDWRQHSGPGHTGAMTVGRQLGITYGPDHLGQEYAWAWGDWLNPDIIPEVRKAQHLVEMGVAGASVDPGGRVVARLDPETGAKYMSEFTIGGATLVPIPAFSALRLYTFDEDTDWDDGLDMVMPMEGPEDSGDCGCGDGSPKVLATGASFTVNSSGWRGLPLAPRDAVFDNDDAVKRIAAWANVGAQGADVNKLRRAFMWYDPSLPPTDPTSYRLPVGDIVNGELTLIYHAIYAAAALLSGAHGGLPGVDESDRSELRNVISEIYPEMASAFNDSSIRAPWDRSMQEGVQMSTEYAAAEPYGDVKYADPGYRDSKKRYPIDTPDHIRAAWAYINVPKNAKFYDAEQLKNIKARIQAAAKKAGIEISSDGDESAAMKEGMHRMPDGSMMSDAEMRRRKKKMMKRDNDEDDSYSVMYPVEPPKAWFDNPRLAARTPITVTPEGRVFGHIAAWGECHRDFAGRECVLAPKSRKGYEPFHLGTVYTAEGEPVRVGKIVMDTRHADIGLGYTAAAVHYDNTGDEVAVVRAGEDEFGVWVAGAVVPEATPSKVAKLRRSPISGDWRRVEGNLELTAALAVNVPAFPVYAMDGDEQLALVAAGTVDPIEEPVDVPPTGIMAPADLGHMIQSIVETVFTTMEAREQQQERAVRLSDLQEDEEIYAQRARLERFSALTAAAQPPGPAPTPVQPPQAPAEPAPVPAPTDQAPVETDPDQVWPPPDPELVALQAQARFSIIDEPAEGQPTAPGADRQAPSAGPTPSGQQQAPVNTPAQG